MTHERANRIAWVGWAATLPLAYLGPVMRALTGVRGSGRWPVYAAIGVMLIVLLLIRRDRRALSLAIDMSASALAIGATGGFVSVALMAGRPLAALLALKWAFGAAFLTWLFRRALHDTGRLSPEEEAKADALWDLQARFRRHLGVTPDADLNAHLATMSEAEQHAVDQACAAEFQREFEADQAASRAKLRRLNARMALLLGTAGLLLVLVGAIVLQTR